VPFRIASGFSGCLNPGCGTSDIGQSQIQNHWPELELSRGNRFETRDRVVIPRHRGTCNFTLRKNERTSSNYAFNLEGSKTAHLRAGGT
jgi:hypothetical protein